MDRYVIEVDYEMDAGVTGPYNALERISEKVNKKLAEGYIPIGGIGCRVGSDAGAVYFQAMFLPESELPDDRWEMDRLDPE